MAAGVATLRRLLADDGAAYRRLDQLGARLEQGIAAAFEERSLPFSVVRVGSILWLVLQEGPAPRQVEAITDEAATRFASLHQALLTEGVYLAPSTYEMTFVSTAHDEAALDATAEAFTRAVAVL